MPDGVSRRPFLAQGSVAAFGVPALHAFAGGDAGRDSGIVTDMTDEALVTRLSSRIPVLMEQAAVPGLSIAVVREGRLLWTRGFGRKSADEKASVTTETIFEAASLSKPVFAYGVLQLCEKGTLDLDAPLTEHLPEPYVPDEPRLSLITARMVLSHTTGFPNWRPRGQPLALQSPPGERFGYSGEGYVYLQRVVERLTGQTLQEYIDANVLRPFRMRSSTYVWTDACEKETAIGHSRRGASLEKEKPAQPNAAFSLQTTPSDFAAFVIQLLGTRKESTFQITAPSARAMLKPQSRINRFLSWGLGWGLQRTEDGDSFWHWGSNTGFKCFVAASRRQKAGVVIMTNSDNGLRLCPEIVVAVLGGDQPAFAWSGVDL